MNINKVEYLTNKYKDTFDGLNARIYTSTPTEELLFLRWWMHLKETETIDKLLKPSAHSISGFLNVFKPPSTVMYSTNKENQIDKVAWLAPTNDGCTHQTAYSGLWLHPNKRKSNQSYQFIVTFYNLAFEVFDAIIGATWQQALLALHTKVGYDIIGCIPNYYNELYGYLVYLTNEKFQSSKFYKLKEKIKCQ